MKCTGFSWNIKLRNKGGFWVFTYVFRKNADNAIMKLPMYVVEVRDLDFLRVYLAGLVLTLAV